MANWLGLPLFQKYKGLDVSSLPLNRAFVLANTSIDDVGVYSVKSDCYKCPYKLAQELRAGEEVAWEVDTAEEESWKIMHFADYEYMSNHFRGGLICQGKPTLEAFGVYRLEVGECEVKPELPPIQPYLPLVTCGLLFLCLILIYLSVKQLLNCRKKEIIEAVENIEKLEYKTKSLNLFRGLLMIIIIFTTLGGGGYPFMNKKVGGVSIPDIAFSALAWTIGVHIPHAVNTEMSNNIRRGVIAGKIFLRSFVLIVLSLSIDSLTKLNDSNYILWSPLIRISVAYFLAAITYVLTVRRLEKNNKSITWTFIGSMTTMLWSWVLFAIISGMFVVGILYFANYNTLNNRIFGTISNYSNIESEVTLVNEIGDNVLVNTILVGNSKSLLDVNSYFGFSAGLLGTLSTVMYTALGMKTGVILTRIKTHSGKTMLSMIWASIITVIGLTLALVPLPMNVWPIATIFLISGICTSLHLVLNLWNIYQKSSIVVSLGSGCLVILCGHLIFSNSFPFTFITLNNYFWCLLQNIWTVELWLIIAEILARENIKLNI